MLIGVIMKEQLQTKWKNMLKNVKSLKTFILFHKLTNYFWKFWFLNVLQNH